ncbi:putative mediator of RNA polymerase II transcription subunit 26c [Raphanus sativus]|uniref:Probable mediator of RNA polymerase II transcription subunit 26c n=1 Tax=Raphanus sativus TaxID=3726 RepID=A0A6J0MYN8_RAPSA|nr:probable mediator of RNA polymerase II transcription subunit 26c [Raphanus sativus]KAJ4908602.1 putative mediator of RNA polymerase II transcription subunit 26c [Raphanus sativus]
MDLDDFRSVMENAGVDVWTFIDTAILVASLDYGQELKRRRDNIVERLYATSMANKCRNCDFGVGGGGEAVVARANGSVHEEEEEGEEEEDVREKAVNDGDDEEGEEDDGYDPFAGLFDDEQKSVLEIKERLEDPDLSEEDLVELLQNLDDMEITFQALQETDIGRHVNKVRKHQSNEVRRLAKQLVKKWKETVDEWVKLNPPGDLEPPSLIADEDSPQQRAALRNGYRQQVPDFGYSPVPQSQNGYSSSSRNSNVSSEPERKPRPVAPPPRRESPSQAKPSRPIQREKEHKEIDFDSARKRLQQNYRQAENAKKQRTIQVMDIHEIPKPKKGGFFPRRGGSSQGGGRHW